MPLSSRGRPGATGQMRNVLSFVRLTMPLALEVFVFLNCTDCHCSPTRKYTLQLSIAIWPLPQPFGIPWSPPDKRVHYIQFHWKTICTLLLWVFVTVLFLFLFFNINWQHIFILLMLIPWYILGSTSNCESRGKGGVKDRSGGERAISPVR